MTSLGSIIVLAISYIGSRRLSVSRPAAGCGLAHADGVFGGIALVDLLKFVLARPRPDVVAHAARVFTASFPSGHASLSAITYLTIAALLAQSQSSFKIGIYFISLAVILTIVIGVSRLYLGVHYPTDILAGWCIGTAWAIGCWAIPTWFEDTKPRARSIIPD